MTTRMRPERFRQHGVSEGEEGEEGEKGGDKEGKEGKEDEEEQDGHNEQGKCCLKSPLVPICCPSFNFGCWKTQHPLFPFRNSLWLVAPDLGCSRQLISLAALGKKFSWMQATQDLPVDSFFLDAF
eukprot:764641-Hanusia_phi.AAC.3